jgi:uncharacterized protein (DUF983 family)
MFLSLWLAGTPINASFSLEWIKAALSTSLPMWVTLAVLGVATIITGLFFRQRAKTAEERAQWVSVQGNEAEGRSAESGSLNLPQTSLVRNCGSPAVLVLR